MDHRCLFGHRVPEAFTFAIQNRMCPMCGNQTVTETGFEAAKVLARDGGLEPGAAFSAVRVLEGTFVLSVIGAAVSGSSTPAPAASGGVPLGGDGGGIVAAAPPRPAPVSSVVPVVAPVAAPVVAAPVAAVPVVAPPPASSASVSIAAATMAPTSSLDDDDDVVVEDEGHGLPEPAAVSAPEPSALKVGFVPGKTLNNNFAPEDEDFFKIR